MDCNALRCTTHVRGLKCELMIDDKTLTVTITGVGHRIWRDDFFPKVTKGLFIHVGENAQTTQTSHASECIR